ncbi:MAG TPA: hypothetical protein VL243_14650 [Vicinamibacterales bacterium]|nr:hypothetical protein [Vicinamibacterales bacterium]
MRVPVYLLGLCLTALAGLPLLAQTPGQPQSAPTPVVTNNAEAVLAAAREALGTEKRIAGVKTIVATGRTRQVQGDNLVPIEFEINIEVPDKYVRTDEIPARESGPTSRGFNGAALIQLPEAAPARAGGPAPAAAAARPGAAAAPAAGGAAPVAGTPAAPPDPTATLRQDFARLTLGMFATSFSSFPLTFSYAGQAEAPEGKADVVDVKGPANFAARLFINSQTHVPLMLSWTTPPVLVPVVAGQPPPATLPPGGVVFEVPGPAPAATATPEERQKYQADLVAARAKAMQTAKPTENRIYYADYRDVDGLKLPFRIRRAVGATTVEETTFDRFRVNGKIDPKKFEVRK